MSQDHFSVTSSTGWFGRIGNSIKGILIGLVLIVVSVPVLFFNEGRAVKTRKTLEEGAKSVVAVSAEDPSSSNDGKLIYFTGKADAEGSLVDDEFKVSAAALKLRRKVEFYNPLFPALRSSPTAVQEPPAKSKFLAVTNRVLSPQSFSSHGNPPSLDSLQYLWNAGNF